MQPVCKLEDGLSWGLDEEKTSSEDCFTGSPAFLPNSDLCRSISDEIVYPLHKFVIVSEVMILCLWQAW